MLPTVLAGVCARSRSAERGGCPLSWRPGSRPQPALSPYMTVLDRRGLPVRSSCIYRIGQWPRLRRVRRGDRDHTDDRVGQGGGDRGPADRFAHVWRYVRSVTLPGLDMLCRVRERHAEHRASKPGELLDEPQRAPEPHSWPDSVVRCLADGSDLIGT